MICLNYTNSDKASCDIVHKAWHDIAWVSPEALRAVGVTDVVRDAACWSDGYAVIYEGAFDELEAALFVAAGLYESLGLVDASDCVVV